MSPWVALLLQHAVAVGGLSVLVLLVGCGKPHPRWMHALWLVVLAKFVTPPLIHVPIPGLDRLAAETSIGGATGAPARDHAALLEPVLLGLWGTGTALVLGLAAARTHRFLRLVGAGTPAPAWMDTEARAIARRLGLRRPPVLVLVSRRMPPCSFSLGRRARVVLPASLVERLDAVPRRMIIGHELVHVARRDGWLRLAELLVVALFWWHPSAWLLRRELHRWEEQCCDGRLLAMWPEHFRAYARALVETVDFIAGAAAPPPIGAPFGAGDTRARLVAILDDGRGTRTGRRARGAVVAAVLLLPAVPALTAGDAEPRWTVNARDPAGEFQLELVGRTVRGVVLGEERLPAGRWRQDLDVLNVYQDDGGIDFSVELGEGQSISWTPRRPRPGEAPDERRSS